MLWQAILPLPPQNRRPRLCRALLHHRGSAHRLARQYRSQRRGRQVRNHQRLRQDIGWQCCAAEYGDSEF